MIIRNKKHLCRDKKIKRGCRGNAASLIFLRTNAFALTADIFTNTNTVLIYYYEKHFYNIRFTWIVQRKM